MDEITSALVGIGLVLAAVFAPMVFFPGSTGVIYRQFSMTVIVSMLLSVAGRPHPHAGALRGAAPPVAKGHEAAETGFRLLRPFFLWFDRVFFRLARRLLAGRRARPRPQARFVAVFLLIVALMVFLYLRMPTGYLPDEDQGMLIAHGPAARRLDARADQAVMDKVQSTSLSTRRTPWSRAGRSPVRASADAARTRR